MEAGNVGQHYYTWRYDGTVSHIAFTAGNDIWLVDEHGAGLTNLTHGLVGEMLPAWSPDGTRLAFISSLPDDTHEIYVVDIDTGVISPVVTGEDLCFRIYEAPSWAPDGDRLAFAGERGCSPIGPQQGIFVVSVDGGVVAEHLRPP